MTVPGPESGQQTVCRNRRPRRFRAECTPRADRNWLPCSGQTWAVACADAAIARLAAAACAAWHSRSGITICRSSREPLCDSSETGTPLPSLQAKNGVSDPNCNLFYAKIENILHMAPIWFSFGSFRTDEGWTQWTRWVLRKSRQRCDAKFSVAACHATIDCQRSAAWRRHMVLRATLSAKR